MNTDSPSSSPLNEKRRLAVKLRLEGRKLKDIAQLVELSSPTIIAAHKQFLEGGWEAVDVKPRGRPSGDRNVSRETIELLRTAALETPADAATPWTHALLARHQGSNGTSARTVGKYLDDWGLSTPSLYVQCKTGGQFTDWLNRCYKTTTDNAKKNNGSIFWAGAGTCDSRDDNNKQIQPFLYAHSTRGKYFWLAGNYTNDVERFIDFFNRLLHANQSKDSDAHITVIWKGQNPARNRQLKEWLEATPGLAFVQHPGQNPGDDSTTAQTITEEIPAQDNNKDSQSHNSQNTASNKAKNSFTRRTRNNMSLTHLQRLEAESIHIMREVIAEAENPAMLYSIGKDSAVMLHLAQKAFYPAKPPFPLLHVDTGWKFQAMYDFRDQVAKSSGLQLIVHKNPEGVEKGVNPFSHGSALHTDIMKTEGLKQALDKHGFDVTFGGARRDEEKSRAKERVLSFRTETHRWDPKNQRPELWNLYNTYKKKGESIRAFPLSNWTELDIWQYIHLENIPVVPLYFAAERPVVLRDGTWIMVDDERMPMNEGEAPIMKRVRFRTLGCYPLTGAIESTAATVPEVVEEMLLSKQSERQGRMIDHDNAASMEKKKQEGYF